MYLCLGALVHAVHGWGMAREPGGRRRHCLKKELAVVMSVVATVVLLIQRFIMEHQLLLQPSHALALESSVHATTLALTRLQMMFSVAAAAVDQVRDPHSSEAPEHSEDTTDVGGPWFVQFLAKALDDATWQKTFRMSRSSFNELLTELQPILERDSSIPANCKLGAGLYRLAHGTTFRSIGKKFGMPKSIARQTFHEVCKGLEEKLGYLFEFPSTTEGLRPIIEGFSAYGMPNCCGALACTRFIVERPTDDIAADYSDFSGHFSVVMQVVVDSRGRFLDISVGWPGAIPPASILQRSRFYSRVESSSELLNKDPIELSYTRQLVAQYVVGDQEYPLFPWLITPYTETDLSEPQEAFNRAHSSARERVGKAFGLLKGRWKLLRRAQNVDHFEILPFVVAASCVLQNFLINRGEQSVDDVVPEVDAWAPLVPTSEVKEFARHVRDAIALHISSVIHVENTAGLQV